MSQINSGGPKHQTRLHTANILFATLASMISVVGGVYSLKSNFFQPKSVYGELAGYVRDEKLARPLSLATIEVSDAGEGVLSTLSTDDNGSYSLKDLKEGNYRIKASAPMHLSDVKRVTIQKNRTSTIDFNLTPVEENGFPRQVSTYPDSSPPRPYRPYPSNLPPDDGLTQRQPTGAELWVKTGALLVQQMLEKKEKTS